jgi:hypothetical protein
VTALAAPAVGDAVPRAAPPPPDPRLAAAAAGIAGAAEGRLTDLGRSHLVHRVDAAGGSVVVKRAGEAARAAGRTLDAELFVYRLGTWRRGVADVLPRALLIDERRGVLVLEAAPAEDVASMALAAGWRPDPDMAAALGRALAGVHAGARGVPVPHEVSSGVLDLPHAGSAVLGLDRAKGLAETVGRDPVLAGALERAARSWTPSCLVHGDVKWDNCLIQRDATPPTVRLVDWELAGWGDPAWDLAAALAQGSALALGEPSAADAGQAALVAGYASVGGRDAPARTGRFWPARVVHLALECAEAGADDVADELLDTARALAAVGDALDDRVSAWIG